MNPPSQEAIRSHRASKAFFAAIFLLIILLLLLSGRNKSAEPPQGAVTSTPAQAAAVAQPTQPPTPEPATQPLPTPTSLPAPEPTSTPTPEPAPVTPTLATPEIDEEGHLVLHGTGEPGATLAIFANGEKLGEVEVGPDGQWTFDAGKLEPGEYLFDIQTLDAAGESVNQTSAPAFTVPEPTPVTPTLATPEIDEEGHLVLHGTGEPGATLAIFANGEKLGEVEVGPDGQWTFDAGKLEPGEYLFDIQTLDAAGESVNQTSAPAFTVPEPTPTTPPCTPYIVKKGDWLSKLALAYLGDVNAYMKIIEATNAMAEKDPSFAVITDPHRIEPGQKLCIPK